jgi:citronellol/citronellal dehydrogenase
VAVVGKTATPHPRLPGTVDEAVREVESAGGKAIGCIADVRFEDQMAAAVSATVKAFGGIDVLVNNASAISLTRTEETDMKRFDLMLGVNTRGTFLCSKLCIPHLRKSENPHILMLSPPLTTEPRWFAPHLAYSVAKYGMSLCVLGLAKELESGGIAVNALWPRTVIRTAAVQNLLGGDQVMARARSPEIVADAAHVVLTTASRTLTGQFLIDEQVLREHGTTDFSQYANVSEAELLPDFFV